MTYFEGQTIPPHKDTIMVHCLATSSEWAIGKSAAKMMEVVTRWHTDPKPKGRGWSAVAYAAIIAGNGTFALGRDRDHDGNVLEETAAAARGWNTNAIHIALAGGRGSHEHDAFPDNYTPEQDRTLRGMIAEIEMISGRKMKLMGHNEVAAKACPGFQVRPWFATRTAQQRPTQPKPDAPATATQQSPWAALFKALSGLFGGKK